ncbi:MAG: MMPL family transporter [Chitinophagaceae bacterium]|nr:MMPL family transporter [Chitinophagaceae bacterium]MCA6495723.1 MMPL family transporter [Chitinophagaceae bacterium]MCA6499770.1 MMPL family transporter [Chitinophagaceae bacterium]
MWYTLGKFILKYRLQMLLLLTVITAFMGWKASQVQLSYDFTRALPTDNQKYREYQQFLRTFGADANTVVVGIQTDKMYDPAFFNQVSDLHQRLKKVKAVTGVLSVPEAVGLVNDTAEGKLIPTRLFHPPYSNAAELDSARQIFESLPFYQTLLYNPDTKSYLLGISVNKDTMNSKGRTRLMNDILAELSVFEKATGTELYVSGLPYIRTIVGNKIKAEMNWFLIGSLALSVVTLFLFFWSFSTTLMSLIVVGMGVIWSLGTLVLFGYKITLLTALIPPLVVVIGIPNCIYFLNKYHTVYLETKNKEEALVTMVGKMGVVTLFCNIAAAIGFAVFALTKSDLLKEFGVVAGINIMALFFVSLLFIPAVLSYLPPPAAKHVRYLENKWLQRLLVSIERWAFQHAGWVYGVTAIALIVAVAGIFRIKSEGFIVDDLPRSNKIYTDLKWFEKNFGGVMPLEIIVDTKKRKNVMRMKTIQKMDELSEYIEQNPETARPLSFVEGLKFVRQAYFDGDSSSYAIPTETDLAFIGPYLQTSASARDTAGAKGVAGLLNNFIDSNRQMARISVNMKDIGSARLPVLLDEFQQKANQIFDTTAYRVTFTGSSVSFVEGSGFIIRGLKESIMWAFLLISLCMLYLFRSFRILICSLIPNLVPLVITAGVMGWVGIALKPSTVLLFSVALGIAIDVTIRFLVNFKQELSYHDYSVSATLVQTIRHTGISILYTSLVLIAGFIIFCWSDFGGTKALGWLTSLTLVVGTLTNLVLLPVLILSIAPGGKKK